MRELHYNEYICFENFLGTNAKFDELHLEVCKSMSKCKVSFGTGGYQHPSYSRGLTGGVYLDKIVNELPEDARNSYKNMSIGEKTMFASFYLGYNALPIIYVRGTNSYVTKNTTNGSTENENTKHFEYLYDWINNSKLFTDTGRITIWLSPQGYEVRKHMDLPPETKYSLVDEFIWLNPRGKKKFYLEDNNGVEIEMDTQSGWFNSYQYHGARASHEQNYTLRIDGVFSKEARDYVREQQRVHDERTQ